MGFLHNMQTCGVVCSALAMSCTLHVLYVTGYKFHITIVTSNEDRCCIGRGHAARANVLRMSGGCLDDRWAWRLISKLAWQGARYRKSIHDINQVKNMGIISALVAIWDLFGLAARETFSGDAQSLGKGWEGREGNLEGRAREGRGGQGRGGAPWKGSSMPS